MKLTHKIRYWMARKLFDLAKWISPVDDIMETLYKHTQIFGTGMVTVDPKKIYKEEL